MRETKKNRTKKTIIDAALSEFVKNGITATTFDQIAEHAGLARRTVYYHFSDKLDILHAVIDPQLEKAIEEIKEISKSDTGVEALTDFCLRFCKTSPGLISLFRSIQKEGIENFSELHASFLKEFGHFLHILQSSTPFRFDNAEINMRLIFFSLFPLIEIISSEADYEAEFLDIFMKTLLFDVET